MAKKALKRANGSQEKLSARMRKAYQAGYVKGFEDSARQGVSGNRFMGARGYSRGYGDKRRIVKIERKYNNYKSKY